MGTPVPFTGSQSPFLHGAYLVGEKPIFVGYTDFVKNFTPKQREAFAIGALYFEAVKRFAGPCVKFKTKNNKKWPVVKSVKTGKLRVMDPRYVQMGSLCIHCFLRVRHLHEDHRFYYHVVCAESVYGLRGGGAKRVCVGIYLACYLLDLFLQKRSAVTSQKCFRLSPSKPSVVSCF